MTTQKETGFWSGLWQSLIGQSRLNKGEEAFPFSGYNTPSGSTVTAENALKLSAVWSCVRLRSQTIASLPLHLRDSQKNHALSHPLYRLLHDAPNADMCASEYWEGQIASLDLWGNGYSLIHRNNGKLISLEPLNPQKMTVKRTDNGSILYIYDVYGKEAAEYSEDDIFHLRGFTLDGLIGLSPIKYAAEVIGGQIDANKAAQNEWKNGLKVGGFIKTGERILKPEQREQIRSSLAQFGRPENAGKWMVLEAGMEPSGASSIRINPHDAQLLESRYFGIEEICRAFGVPPQLIGHTDKASSWASSLEQTNMGFLTYSLRPTIVRIEQTITRKLLKPNERGEYKPKFAVEGLLRADSQTRAGFYSQMLQNGVLSRNEVRRLEDLPPVEGGDALTVQLNMTTLNNLEES